MNSIKETKRNEIPIIKCFASESEPAEPKKIKSIHVQPTTTICHANWNAKLKSRFDVWKWRSLSLFCVWFPALEHRNSLHWLIYIVKINIDTNTVDCWPIEYKSALRWSSMKLMALYYYRWNRNLIKLITLYLSSLNGCFVFGFGVRYANGSVLHSSNAHTHTSNVCCIHLLSQNWNHKQWQICTYPYQTSINV